MKKSLTTAKLFDVTALAKHLLDCDHYLFRSEKANLSSFGYSQAKFTLFYSEDIKEVLKDSPLPKDVSYAFEQEIMSDASIAEIMEYLINENVINDEEILRSWNEHFEWHTKLEEQLFPISIADFIYPDCYSDHLFTYSDIFVIQRFADLLTTVTDVSFWPEAMESQYAIINEMLPFVVNELIPITWSMDEVSVERITGLVQKLSVYLAKLFWISSL